MSYAVFVLSDAAGGQAVRGQPSALSLTPCLPSSGDRLAARHGVTIVFTAGVWKRQSRVSWVGPPAGPGEVTRTCNVILSLYKYFLSS